MLTIYFADVFGMEESEKQVMQENFNKFFVPQNPADMVETILMNCVKEYCESHPSTMDVLEAMKLRQEESIRLLDEASQQLICEMA